MALARNRAFSSEGPVLTLTFADNHQVAYKVGDAHGNDGNWTEIDWATVLKGFRASLRESGRW
jgi:hypothetical protein